MYYRLSKRGRFNTFKKNPRLSNQKKQFYFLPRNRWRPARAIETWAVSCCESEVDLLVPSRAGTESIHHRLRLFTETGDPCVPVPWFLGRLSSGAAFSPCVRCDFTFSKTNSRLTNQGSVFTLRPRPSGLSQVETKVVLLVEVNIIVCYGLRNSGYTVMQTCRFKCLGNFMLRSEEDCMVSFDNEVMNKWYGR